MASTCHTAPVGPDHILQRLKAIRDPRMRVLALVEAFGRGDPGTWVELLEAILTRAHRVDDPDAVMAVEVITHAAADPALAYEARKDIYVAATQRGMPAIARLFLSASPSVVPAAQLKKQLAPERALKPSGRALTLGERKALARTHSREQILLLLRDPHPAVVGILLENPHVTESDILRIASTRPAVPEALAKIACHPRWSVRHPVKRALVMNPSTPLADAIRVVTTLRVSELAELAHDPMLSETLRRHCAELHAATSHRRRPVA